jgi:hypothetical protein
MRQLTTFPTTLTLTQDANEWGYAQYTDETGKDFLLSIDDLTASDE